MAGKAIYAALQAVQRELKAPKGQYNSFGKYKYRSCEDIVEAVKPLLNEQGLILTMSDEVVGVADRVYIKATCKVIDVANGDVIETSALARESLTKKGMDDSQITGTASSYARKYALNGLFAIDDTKDADTDQYKQQTNGAKTTQNGAGRAQNAKPNNYTKAPTKASQNDDLMAKAKKQLKAVDMFIPMSSRMSSTSALSSASVRNVMLVVIVCTPIVRKDAYIISDCAERYKEAA
jgi:hypothetical protein